MKYKIFEKIERTVTRVGLISSSDYPGGVTLAVLDESGEVVDQGRILTLTCKGTVIRHSGLGLFGFSRTRDEGQIMDEEE